MFVALTHIQAFYILNDLISDDSTVFINTYITRRGFFWACIYLFIVSSGLFIISVASKNSRKNEKLNYKYMFFPPIYFYPVMFLFILSLAYLLIFIFIGAGSFIEQSRPGLESGTTVFLILLSVGVYPIIIRFLTGDKPKKWDYSCLIATIISTILFSRIHVILYIISVIFAYYYGGGCYLIKSLPRFVAKSGFIVLLGVIVFVGFGALRDALNFTTIDNVFRLLNENPDAIRLLSIEKNYRISVEGMSGLASAITYYFNYPSTVSFGLGIDWIISGLLQPLPGSIKTLFISIYDLINSFNWHTLTIVASGLETSFTSYFIFGPFIYIIIFYLISWRLNSFLLDKSIHPYKRLVVIIFVSNSIFFVRGSMGHWIGFLIAYLLILLMLRPFIYIYCNKFKAS